MLLHCNGHTVAPLIKHSRLPIIECSCVVINLLSVFKQPIRTCWNMPQLQNVELYIHQENSFTSTGLMMGQNLDCWDTSPFWFTETETFGGLFVLLSSDYKSALVTCADLVHYCYIVICLLCIMSSPIFSHGYQNHECQFSIILMQFLTVCCQ